MRKKDSCWYCAVVSNTGKAVTGSPLPAVFDLPTCLHCQNMDVGTHNFSHTSAEQDQVQLNAMWQHWSAQKQCQLIQQKSSVACTAQDATQNCCKTQQNTRLLWGNMPHLTQDA